MQSAPFRDKYCDDPQATPTSMTVRCSFADPGVAAIIDGFAGQMRVGLYETTVGDDSDV